MVKLSDLITHLKVHSSQYGEMELSELLLKDISWLDQPLTRQLAAREFTVQLIFAHLLTPKLDIQEIRKWSDEELSSVAVQWLRKQQKECTLSDEASFDETKTAIYAYHDSLTAETRKQIETIFKPQMEFLNGLSKTIFPSFEVASSLANLGRNVIGISQVANSIVLPSFSSIAQHISPVATELSSLGQSLAGLGIFFEKVSGSTQLVTDILNKLKVTLTLWDIKPALLNVTQFFDGLPDLKELDQIFKEFKEGGEAFKKAGYGFITGDYVSFKTVQRFASVSPRVRSAVITGQLAAETRSEHFEKRLGQIFQQSSVLRRRWCIVEQAIKAHRRREYNIAIPALLAQVEGVVGDALILNGLIISQGHKLYAKGLNGKPKLNKKGVPEAVHGVGRLIQHSKWQTHPALQGVADLITNQLAGERNHILHGRKTNYGVAKLSVQGLLLLFVLAAEVVVFETGNIP